MKKNDELLNLTDTNSSVKIYLALGSNLGDRLAAIESSIALLKDKITGLQLSKVYETEPWGVTDQPAFLNACLSGFTELRPDELLRLIKNIEVNLGRVKRSKWGPREIDIDILFYGDMIINKPDLIIPHPYLAQRSFVLVPLNDIAPDLIHPINLKSVSKMTNESGDEGLKVFVKT